MDIREVQEQDLRGLLELYKQLHENEIPLLDSKLEKLWKSIIQDPNHHILVGEVEGKIVSSCVIVIILNLTHKQKPYALIENVVTEESSRKKGYATAILNYAREIALKEGCYKIMLLTGAKKESTLNFYENAGYNRKDKTAFIQWLP